MNGSSSAFLKPIAVGGSIVFLEPTKMLCVTLTGSEQADDLLISMAMGENAALFGANDLEKPIDFFLTSPERPLSLESRLRSNEHIVLSQEQVSLADCDGTTEAKWFQLTPESKVKLQLRTVTTHVMPMPAEAQAGEANAALSLILYGVKTTGLTSGPKLMAHIVGSVVGSVAWLKGSDSDSSTWMPEASGQRMLLPLKDVSSDRLSLQLGGTWGFSTLRLGIAVLDVSALADARRLRIELNSKEDPKEDDGPEEEPYVVLSSKIFYYRHGDETE